MVFGKELQHRHLSSMCVVIAWVLMAAPERDVNNKEHLFLRLLEP